MQDVEVLPDKEAQSGPCDCCGAASRTVWGKAVVDGELRAVYYVHWTVGEVARHGANVDLLLGRWGDDSTAAQRVAVSLVLHIGDRGPVFGSIDAHGRPHAETGLAEHIIPATQVLGNPLASDAYMLLHAILGQDPRVRELIDAVAEGAVLQPASECDA